MKCEYIIIYYIHPAIMTYTPVAKDDIEERCLSKIIVGDGPKIEEISGILTKIKENQEGSKGITDSVTFKIKLKFPNEEKIWFVDKSHNFEFNTIDKGKIPTKYFESLISIFDNYTKVVDLKYWEEFKKDK